VAADDAAPAPRLDASRGFPERAPAETLIRQKDGPARDRAKSEAESRPASCGASRTPAVSHNPEGKPMALRGAVLCLLLLTAAPAWAEERSGVGVDAKGGAVIDPTENVKALNAAEAHRQDGLRDAEARLQNALREADAKLQSALREAETRRINELAAQKQSFDLELARVNRAALDSSALLLATQVKELKTDSSERTAKLEEFANQQRGRSSGASDIWGLIYAVLGLGLGFIMAFFALQRHRRGISE
jgi:hypothetical protein